MRRVPVSQFILGNRQTSRNNDEIVTAILVPKPQRPARSTFLKLGARKYLVISIVMVAAIIEETLDGRAAEARVAIGSCSAVAQRLTTLESALKGARLNRMVNIVQPEHLAGLSPISDVRGTADYRRDGALELVKRMLREFG
jgi:CO/xanthine dehydrogenase FAD-binding subunit